jgi:nucleoside-diphosphate-sugar epimerase
MHQRLGGKIALITGGNSGIGLATAKRFVEEGARVYLTGRRQAALDAAVQEIGKGAVGVQGDVSSLADLDRLYAQIEREQGRLDICSRTPASPSSGGSARSPRTTTSASSTPTSGASSSRSRRRSRCSSTMRR